MLALTLWRPWARLVANGTKRIENRPWVPPSKMKGETIAIHAGAKWDPKGESFLRNVMPLESFEPESHPIGILATAKIAGWFLLGEPHRGLLDRMFDHTSFFALTPLDLRFSFGPCCWVLEVQHQFKEPIPCPGMQKLWTVPAAVQRKIEAAEVK